MKRKQARAFILQDAILSCIVVTRNDEDIIANILQAMHSQLKKLNLNYEILIVDNNSLDHTVDNIRRLYKTIPFTRILKLSKEYDTEIALTAGLDNCIGDYVILFNIYTDPPDILSTLLNKLLENYDIVLGKSTSQLASYGFVSRLFLKTIQKISRHHFIYNQGYLLALNRKAVNSIMQTRRKSRNLSYINYLIGFNKTSVHYKPIKKYLHKLKKQSFLEIAVNVTDIIISNSFRPIRFLSLLGMLTSFLFLFYVFFIAIISLFFDRNIAPQGWVTIGAAIGTMFALLFSFLTIMAEYIIRILDESRNEPIYFVADEIDKSVILPKKGALNVL